MEIQESLHDAMVTSNQTQAELEDILGTCVELGRTIGASGSSVALTYVRGLIVFNIDLAK